MKIFNALLLITCLIIPISAAAQDKDKKFALTVEFGPLMSVNGSYSATDNLRDIVNPGPVFGLGVNMKVNSHYFVELSVTNGWMTYKDSRKPVPGQSPSYAMTNINFENIYYVYHGKLNIKLLAGPGIYYWRFTDDGPFSTIQTFEGEKLNKMSIGGNIGIGIEWNLAGDYVLSLTSRYHYILSKDRFFFGEHFSEQGLLDIRVGMICFLNKLF